MPSEENMTLEFNHYLKSAKVPSTIYVDLEYLIKKVDGCEDNPEKPFTTKVGEHAPCCYSMSTTWKFDVAENKHDVYGSEDCMKKFCE